MIKIVFFAPYPQIFSDIRGVFDDRPDRDEFEYEIRQDITNNPLKDLDADIIIARGFTARSLRRAGLPCTELQVSGYDIMAAIFKCRKLAPDCARIAIIGPFNMIYGSEAINGILSELRVTPYITDDETLLEDTLRRALEDGNTAVVGSHSSVLLASKRGIPAVMIESGREAIASAISHAREAVLMRRQEQEHAARIANIMNYSFQGIISTDREGNITMANSYVYSILKLENSLLGTPLISLFPDIPVDAVIRSGAKILSDLRKWRTMTLLVNCVPVGGEVDRAGCVLTFQNATQIQRQKVAIQRKLYRSECRAKHRFSDLLYESASMAQLLQDAREYSYADAHVLMCGETGTGKSMLAESIHNSSRRKNGHFVTVSCMGLSENALERELFGYVEGAVRGVSGERAGAIELAHQGTLFLDEVDALPARLQLRLLRVLEEQETGRIGSVEQMPVNLRIIASTARDMGEELKQGRFRSDLFYRLDVLELHLPPLRERPEDIPPLVGSFLGFERQRTGSRVEQIAAPALELLRRYDWPGNVRELENFCERLAVLCGRPTARVEDAIRAMPALASLPGKLETRAEVPVPASDERTQLLQLLDRFEGSRKKTAEYLQIDPSTLWRRMKKLELI